MSYDLPQHSMVCDYVCLLRYVFMASKRFGVARIFISTWVWLYDVDELGATSRLLSSCVVDRRRQA